MKTGPLESAILMWKDDHKWGYAFIFARVLLGFLRGRGREWWIQFDAIIPMPSYRPAGAAAQDDHTAFVLGLAQEEDDENIPFVTSPRLIEKTRATSKMRGQSLAMRRTLAVSELRPALRVPSAAQVDGRRILVYDDVFTEGSTLNEVARALKANGAVEVAGLTLARQTWRSAP